MLELHRACSRLGAFQHCAIFMLENKQTEGSYPTLFSCFCHCIGIGFILAPDSYQSVIHDEVGQVDQSGNGINSVAVPLSPLNKREVLKTPYM